MITLEDYIMSYSEYLANKEYQQRSANLEINSLTESSQVYIEEGFKENLKKYTDKIIAGIQKAWDKFKDNVNKAKLDWSDKEITDAINNNGVNISVNNYIQYDPTFITNLKIQTLDYNTMKDSLKDEATFMNKYYSSIYSKKGNSIGEKFTEACITGRQDTHQVTKDELQSMYDYMKNNKNLLDTISKDLDQVNQAAKNVDYIANMVSAAIPAEGNNTAPNNGGANAAAAANESYRYYFTEADDDKPNQIVSTSPAATNNATNGGDKETKADTQAQKDVQVYFKCTSQILSAMMKTSRDIYHFYDSVVSTHMKNVRGEAKNNKNNNQQEQAPEGGTTTGGTAQINTTT